MIGAPAKGPVTPSASLTVAENAAATPIGLIAPSDASFAAAQLTITVDSLPSDGSVSLNGAALPAQLTAAQIGALAFTPTPGAFNQSSAFSYTATDPAGLSSVGTATLATGPASGSPIVSSPSLTVAENAPATAIGIAAPTDPNAAASQLAITAGALPSDGTVLLADGVTPVTAGQVLSAAQLTGLLFKPASGAFNASSAFTYSVSDPAGNASTGTATLAVGPSVGGPVTTAGTLTVSPGQAATNIGIQAPADPNFSPGQLAIRITALPTDGAVDLADGVTRIALNQVLSVAQLTSLTFLPVNGASKTQSALGYSVTDPAANTSAGSFTLAIGAGAPATAPPSSPMLTTANLITDTATPTVTGTAAPGSLITLLSNGSVLGTASANAQTGIFALAPAAALPLGANTLVATATTSTGVSATSSPVKLFVLPTPVGGVSTPDDTSGDIASVIGQGFQLQFLPGTQAIQLLDGTLSEGTGTNEAFLARVFQGVLGHAPDPVGVGFADDQLASGISQSQIAADILSTPEGVQHYGTASDASFVATIGQGLLGRTLSASDVSTFTTLLANGTSRGALVAEIANAPESQAALAGTTSQVYVEQPTAAAADRLLQTALAREPDVSGVQFATSEMLQAGLTALQVAQQIASTPEFLADHAGQGNADYVNSLYQAGLGHGADMAAQALWGGALASGQLTRAGVLFGIATSAEATAHLTQPI